MMTIYDVNASVVDGAPKPGSFSTIESGQRDQAIAVIAYFGATPMKRDMDLCRQILIAVEADDSGPSKYLQLTVSDPKEQERWDYHTRILADAGLLEAKRGFSGGWDIHGLTWEGHEFVEATRQSQTWEQTKSVTAKVGGWTFGLIKDVAVGIIKGQLKANGVDIA